MYIYIHTYAHIYTHTFTSSILLLGRVRLFETPRTVALRGFPVYYQLPKLMSIESVMPSNHLFLCHPLLLLAQIPPSIFKSANSSVPSLLHSPTLTSIHDYWKNHSLTRQTFVGKVTSLFLNMLSRLVINFLLRSKRLLISWLQSPSAVILEPPKIKSDTVFTVSPSISHEVTGPDAMIFVF